MKQPYMSRRLALLLALGLGGAGVARAQAPTFASSPTAYGHNIGRTAPVQAFLNALTPLRPTAGRGLKVFSAQQGGLLSADANTVLVGNTGGASSLNFSVGNRRPGETVQVSLTRGVENTNGEVLTNPSVWQYTTATGGTGRGVFRPASEVPTATAPDNLLTADFDNDGDPDLLTHNRSTNALLLYLNTGSGSYGAATSLPTNGVYGTGDAVAGDVDGDGDLDLVTTDLAGSGGTVLQTLLNNGSGTFSNGPLSSALYYSPDRLVLGDIDADGDLDLVANMPQQGLIQVRYNTGNGTFLGSTYPGGLQLPGPLQVVEDVALADVDNDFDLDIVAVANGGSTSGTLAVLLNGGNSSGSNTGTFVGSGPGSWQLPLSGFAIALALADLDGDSDLDVAALVQPTGQTAVEVLLNGSGTGSAGTTALGTFGSARLAPAVAEALALAIADVNADGSLDLMTTGGASGGPGTFGPAFNDGLAGFSAPPPRTVGTGAQGLALADVDNDGDVDALVANYAASTVGVRLNGPGPEISVRVALAPTFAAGPVYASGSTFDFGSVPVNTTTAPQFFYVKNLSLTDNLTLTGLNATGAIGSYGGFPAPYGLGPGDSTNFSVSMRPTSAGLHTGSITISNDDLDEGSYVINLTVTGAVPPPTAVTWTGALSTDWATAGNWNPAVVPTASISATIPSTPPNQPLVSTAGAACSNLTTQTGSTVSIAAPGYLTLAGDLQANGRVLMPSGTLEVKGYNVHFDGGITATGGTVLLSGPSAQEVGTNGGNATFWNLTVAARATNAVRPYGGNFGVRRVLRLHGDVDANGGSVNLLSDASGTAMVVNAGGRITGTTTMQRYVGGPNTGLGYRHISAPTPFLFTGSFYGQGYAPVFNPAYNTTGNSVTPFPTFFGFDESRLGAAGVPGPASSFDQGWLSPAAGGATLTAGRGYTVQLVGGSTLNWGGFAATGPVAVGALSHSGTGPFAGYHLLGNPYPAPIDWDSVARPSGLDNAVYVFRSTGQYTGFYDSYVNGLGTLTGGEIAAMQGFFVHVSQNVPSFSFTNAARKTVYATPSFRRDANTAGGRPTLALALRPASGGDADKAFIYFQPGATPAADAEFDAGKLPNPSGLNLASQLGADSYAINGLPLLGTQPLVLPLTVDVPAPGRYELAVGQLVNFAPATTLWLRDALLGTLTPLGPATSYAFDLSGYTAPGRFSIEFRPAGALATAAQLLEAQVHVFPNPARAAGGVTIAAPARASVTLLNALGQQVLPTQIVSHSASLHLPTAGLAAGIYLVRVRTQAGELSRRLLVE